MEKKKKIVLFAAGGLFVVILIAVIVVLVVLLLRKEKEGGSDMNEVYVIDEGNYQQIMEEIDTKVKEGNFETYMTVDWTFPDGASESTDAVLGNSPSNTRPIRCEVLRNDTGEKIFTTGVIPVGAQLPPFKLDADLDAGVYETTCMIYLLEEKGDGTYTDYSSAGFTVTITVEK